MEFTYQSYKELIEMLKIHGYQFTGYENWETADKCVILRHDIDYSLEKALPIARIEAEAGVKSTYFVLVTSDFYNIFSKRSEVILQELLQLGHTIGLHYDEVRYESNQNIDEIVAKILFEAKLLEMAIGNPIEAVSMHRPSKTILESSIEIPGLINSYGQQYFQEFKYVSDSRCRWREPIKDIIKSGKHPKLHILTHAFWYGIENKDISSSVKSYINDGNTSRYDYMLDNITDLEAIMARTEVR